eukprot:1043247_1
MIVFCVSTFSFLALAGNTMESLTVYYHSFKSFILNLIQSDWASVTCIVSLVMMVDNLLSYHFHRNIINDLFDPCSTVLMLIQFMLGIVNVIGFSSYYIQIELILSNGLDPAHLKIAKWITHYPTDTQQTDQSIISLWISRIQYRISVFWFGSSDKYIRFIALSGILNGIVISLLSLQQYEIGGALSLCYILNAIFYLSLIQVSGDFLGLQSDSNLVETNFVMCICGAFNRRYPALCIMILRWLAFRTMLACGLCKWNGSHMWKRLTAMIHHYYTQPLPNPISYYIHNSPRWIHELEVISTFVIEGPLPFLAFGPRWARYLAFFGFEGINLMINTTGNYGFIGALNMTENMSFLDDNAMFQRFTDHQQHNAMSVHWNWWEWVFVPAAMSLMCLYVIASWIPLCGTSKKYSLPFQSYELDTLYGRFRKYRLINYYAKFAGMHEGRYEFVVEGSNNGTEWRRYEFLFKPSTATQIPSIVPLHVPRLDWRTWFLPLYWRRYRSYGSYEPPRWWYQLEEKLKTNELQILKLIKHNPFPIKGPKYIRTYVHQFEFTDWDDRYEDGNDTEHSKRVWWVTRPQSALNEGFVY